MIKPKLPEIADYIDNLTPTIKAGDNAHEGYIVPEIIFTYGDPKSQMFKMLSFLPTILKTLLNSFKSYKSVKKNPVKPKTTADTNLFDEFKIRAQNLGCSSVGFTEVPPDFIFREKQILYRYAFVVTMEMHREAIGRAPARAAGREVWRTYRDLGIVVNRLAAFMRQNGYNAQAGPALGGDSNYVLLAQKAGLGWIGNHGLLISPETGPCQRIAVLYTDVELPVTDSIQHSWVESYCESCGRCVKKCPASAIYSRHHILVDGSRKYIDYKKCAVPFSQSMGCSICIKECSFMRSSYKKIKAGFNG